MADRLVGGLPPGRLPPVLLVYGENGSFPPAWVQEDKAFLEKKGNQVEMKEIPGMADEHDSSANAAILQWFEEGA
jgi:predicted esterase